MSERHVPPIHGADHAPGGPDPIPGGYGIYQIEVFENDKPVQALTDKFNWEIPEDLDGGSIVKVDGYVNSPTSSGSVEVQIYKEPEGGGSSALLVDPIVIEPGNLNAKDSATPPLVTTSSAADVAWGDHLRIDITDIGDGSALGLGVIVYVFPAYLRNVTLEGAKGDPGGVNNWTGAYDSGSSYSTGDSVSSGGSSYVARVDNPTTEPGVDPGWEDEWQLLAERQLYTALTVYDNNLGRELDFGHVALVPVPFPAVIEEAVLVADAVCNLELDIRKDSYANYPPTSGDSIVGSSPPQLVSSNKSDDTALVGWTTSIAAGDILSFEITSVDTATEFALTLKLRRV